MGKGKPKQPEPVRTLSPEQIDQLRAQQASNTPPGYVVLNENFPPMPAGVVEFRLPSNGIPYKNNSIPGGLVYIRPFTGREEMIVNSATINETAKIQRIVAACTYFPRGANAGMLLSTDRMMLLYGLRQLSFGTQYKMPVTCPNCDTGFSAQLDFSKLHIEEMPRKKFDPVTGLQDGTYDYNPDEGIPVTLSNKMELRLRLLDCADQDFIVSEVRKGTASKVIPPFIFHDQLDPVQFLQNILCIYKFNRSEGGELETLNRNDPMQLSQLGSVYLGLHAKDTIKIDREYAKYDVEIGSQLPAVCPACQTEVKVGVYMTPEFFRPTDD